MADEENKNPETYKLYGGKSLWSIFRLYIRDRIPVIWKYKTLGDDQWPGFPMGFSTTGGTIENMQYVGARQVTVPESDPPVQEKRAIFGKAEVYDDPSIKVCDRLDVYGNFQRKLRFIVTDDAGVSTYVKSEIKEGVNWPCVPTWPVGVSATILASAPEAGVVVPRPFSLYAPQFDVTGNGDIYVGPNIDPARGGEVTSMVKLEGDEYLFSISQRFIMIYYGGSHTENHSTSGGSLALVTGYTYVAVTASGLYPDPTDDYNYHLQYWGDWPPPVAITGCWSRSWTYTDQHGVRHFNVTRASSAANMGSVIEELLSKLGPNDFMGTFPYDEWRNSPPTIVEGSVASDIIVHATLRGKINNAKKRVDITEVVNIDGWHMFSPQTEIGPLMQAHEYPASYWEGGHNYG